MAHAEHLLLDPVGIGARAVAEHRARARHVRQALGDEAARAALRESRRLSRRSERRDRRVLDGLFAAGVDFIAQNGVKLLRVLLAHLFGVLGRVRLGRHADDHFGGLRIERGGGVLVFEQMPDLLLEVALADAHHAQRLGVQRAARHRGEPGAHRVEEHGFQFIRRAGEQHGVLAGRAGVLEDHARRGAVVVFDLAAVHRDVRLTAVVLGHRAAPRSEERADLVEFFLVEAKFVTERVSDGLLCQIVLRRAEPAGKDEQIAAAAREVDNTLQPLGVVAHDALEMHVDAQLRELAAQELRVGVQNVAEQKLGSHGNDFSFHGKSPSFTD